MKYDGLRPGGKAIPDVLNTVFEYSCDGILVTDGVGVIIRVNAVFAGLTGYRSVEKIGARIEEVYPDSTIITSIKNKRPVSVLIKNKQNRKILLTSSPVLDEYDNVQLVITNARDITIVPESVTREWHTAQLSEISTTADGKEEMADFNTPVAVSDEMKQVLSLAFTVSEYNVTVLVLGESGVGKEVIAEFIHNNSCRRDGPFITINCGAIPEHLLESELFGYDRGAFTGALKNGKPGLFEAANGGTLFLDELGELPLQLQVKILRAIETKNITRVGASGPTSVDVRIIAATNRDLELMVQEKQFREDLFYRLNVVTITVPPLRDRKDDIIPLSGYFLNHFNNIHHQSRILSPEVCDSLKSYSWPGNVRQLKNIVERMVVLNKSDCLDSSVLPWESSNQNNMNSNSIEINGVLPIPETVAAIEKQILHNALIEYKTSRQIAKAVGLNQSTVVKKLKKYGLQLGFACNQTPNMDIT